MKLKNRKLRKIELRMLSVAFLFFVSGCTINITQKGESEKPSEVKLGSNVTEDNTEKEPTETRTEDKTEEKTEAGKPGTKTEETEAGKSGTESKETVAGKPETKTEETEAGKPGTGTEETEKENPGTVGKKELLRAHAVTNSDFSYSNLYLEQSSIEVNNDGYEGLKMSLVENANSAWKDAFQVYDFAAKNKEAQGNGVYYRLSQEHELIRADETVLSFFVRSRADFMGPTDNPSIAGYTFDSLSGKKLRLEDVISDKEALKKKVLERLKKMENDMGFYGDYVQTVNKNFEDTLNLHWALGSDGLKIHFDTDHIAPYTSGDTRLEFPYDEYAGMFYPRYLPKEKSWVRQVHMQERVLVEGQELFLSSLFDYDRFVSSVTIEFAGKPIVEELDGQDPKAWVMHLSEGRNFLCVEMHGINYFTTVYIYSLKPNGLIRITDIPATIWSTPSPKCVTLLTSMDAFWTFAGYKYYSLEDNGSFQTTDTMYQLCDTYMYTRPLESKIPLELEEVDPTTHQPLGKKELPAYTRFFLYGSDGKTFVEVTTEDEKQYRIPIQRKPEGYGWMVNGKNEEDCFVDLFYAG